MLIDQEMSKEKDSKHNSPNVIAQLMGLESLPKGDPGLPVVRSHGKDYSQHVYGHLGSPFKHWQVEDRFMDKEMLHEVHPSTEHIAYKNDYERGRWSEDVVDKEKMALICQKFMEAKRLSTDERLRQSKQFEDALEVLSSNSDLLIRLLDSQNLPEPHSSPQDERNPITLIKPLKMFDNDKSAGKGKKNDRMIRKHANSDQAIVWENRNREYSPISQKVDESPVQSTRIVILKPSPGRTPELKSLNSPTTSSPQNLLSGNFYQGFRDEDDVLESIKLAKKATQKMHEGLRSYQKDKTLHSSVFESSLNKPFHQYRPGNFIDLEAMSPLPRHSWDNNYTNCWGSPYSTLSLGRASCSPESSVCMEAKKRLSERWNMMALNNKGSQEQRHVQKCSTLGEMLSLSRVKKSATSEVESINEDQEPRISVSCRHTFNEEISIQDSPNNVPRSNSLPASSTVYEPGLSKAQGSKVLKKSKSIGSSFKGKVTSFLFSRNKKSTKKKSSTSQCKDESQSPVTETSCFPASSGVLTDDESQSFSFRGFEECSLAGIFESPSRTSAVSISNGQQQDMITLEAMPGSTEPKPMVPEISSENQDQPSPISVLETPFKDYNTVNDSMKGSYVPLKSNLIDKSPPIESVSRTLSWHDSCEEVASSYSLKSSSLETKVEEQEWIVLVQKLLLAAGLDGQENCNLFHTKWHSLESPLDPSLRDTYVNINNKEPWPVHEARRRKMRSNQKLVFDFVNAALLEAAGYGSENHLKRRMYSGSHFRPLVEECSTCPCPPILVDHIVGQMKELMWEDCGDNHSLVVESVVRKEAVKVGWVELMRLEIDVLGSEIEEKLIQELVEHAVVDFTGRA